MAQELKLMADYAVWPLWDTNGNVDPESLPISAELQARLDAWAEVFDGTVNRDDPRTARWSSPEDAQRWNEQGVALWHDLQHELGPDYVVCYFSEAQADLLFPTDHDKHHSIWRGPHGH